MTALAAGMITTGELISILEAAGITVTVIGIGAYIVRGVKVLNEGLEEMAKETRPWLNCDHCTGYKPNLVSAGEKLLNVFGRCSLGVEKDEKVAFRACMCGCHINYHRGH